MNRQETLKLLEKYQIRPTRSLGQNFLVDDRIIKQICQTAGLDSQDLVIEIGPGIGSLTRELAERAGRVIAVEIDRHLLPALQLVEENHPNCTIIHADALKLDLGTLIDLWPGPVKVVANLPYYITTPLILKILCELPSCSEVVLMVQKEAADRIMARPACKQYGPLAVLSACFGQVTRAITVPSGSFYPVPGVSSCVIRMNPSEKLQISDWNSFLRFLENCFEHRRKTLVNSLKSSGMTETQQHDLQDLLSDLGLAADVRAEMLTREQFLKIYLKRSMT